ncbi:hypothetical protein [Paludifilum halophilum]|uniref:Uncharacterized protein n=1 Tax=Paludifilum halophilum TaxID=1642702 RepID=A0A235B7N1_9BACL|nr:hypothetical protein [Paludifilum halophilum]OYD08314.1 hypothetical protein CHM34_05555 [Paludifilum halophilum]
MNAESLAVTCYVSIGLAHSYREYLIISDRDETCVLLNAKAVALEIEKAPSPGAGGGAWRIPDPITR